MKYTRDLPEDATQELVDATIGHVRDHLASIADSDDDPTTRAEDVEVVVVRMEGKVQVAGTLEAEPDAPYLQSDYGPYAKVPVGLLAQLRDDEVTP
jgi:hypothetical protein